jgi:hypothetical protein
LCMPERSQKACFWNTVNVKGAKDQN